MPSGKYYRTQAQVFARLAVVSSDPYIAERYNHMALEQLAKAEEVEPGSGQVEIDTPERDGGSDIDPD
jgi:hypothetical protein